MMTIKSKSKSPQYRAGGVRPAWRAYYAIVGLMDLLQNTYCRMVHP
jgi:hypothetical protein